MNLDRKKIRPIIKGLKLNENMSTEEQFQNSTLRPIIKMQHDLLVVYFKNYLIAKKCNFSALSELKKLEFITSAFSKDNSFKAELKGLIIGQFTVDEFKVYITTKNDYNKRILAMIKQRLESVKEVF
jgi:hypothetical protein